MTCREFIEFLMEYTSGELSPAQRAEFDRHLEVCEQCVAYLRNYRDAVTLSKAAFRHPDDPVPDDVPEDLVQAIIRARRV